METRTSRFVFLFNSTKGLILVAITMIGIVTAVWGLLSGPMAELGVRQVVVRLLGMDMLQAEREGRIIILYHSIAMAFVAIETYLITALYPMKPEEQTRINGTITVGYIFLNLNFRIPSKFPVSGASRQRSATYRNRELAGGASEA